MKNTAHSAQITLAVALVFGIGISLGGCAADAPDNVGSTGSTQTEQDATTDGGEKAPAEDAGSKGFVDEDGEVPDWVAAGFPIYPAAEVYSTSETGGTFIMGFTVPQGDEQTIYKWLVEQYSQNGWETSGLDDVHSSFNAENADGRSTMINVTDSSFVMSASRD